MTVHELSICYGILEVATGALEPLPRPLPRVERVTVRIGRLTAVVPDTLRHYFDLLTPGTALDGAALNIEEVPIRGHCDECADEFEIETLSFTCPRCGSGLVELFPAASSRSSPSRPPRRRCPVQVSVLRSVLDANDLIAKENRREFDAHGCFVVNLMSAPGSGKTAILERTLRALDGRVRAAVIEGDVLGTLDADRLLPLGVPVVQINTDPHFGGECHLDARMIRNALAALPLDGVDVVFIENVGNLVCPAEFSVGEDRKVMVLSVAEGEDKPLKYPLMFRVSDLLLLNKIGSLGLPGLRPASVQGQRGPGKPRAAHYRALGKDRAGVREHGSTGSCGKSRPRDEEGVMWGDLNGSIIPKTVGAAGLAGAAVHALGGARRLAPELPQVLCGHDGRPGAAGPLHAAGRPALEQVKRPALVWLEFQDCAGCTESFLRASRPSVGDIALDILSVNYHETIMAPSGKAAEKSLMDTVRNEKGKYLVVVEGSIPVKDGGIYCTIGGRTALDIAREVCGNAAATITVGACAFYGGWPSARPIPPGRSASRRRCPASR